MFNRCLRLLAIAFFGFAGTLSAHHASEAPALQGPSSSATAVQLQGYIDELIVENRVAGTTQRFAVFEANDGQRFILRGNGADQLFTGSAVAVTGKAETRTLFLQSATMLAAAAAGHVRAKAAAAGSYRGLLRLGHADNFDGHPSAFFYTLHTDAGGQMEVALAPQLGILANEMHVTASGRLTSDGTLVAERIVIEAAPVAKAEVVAKMVGTSNVLVIPIKFKNAAGTFPADPFPVANLASAVFGTAPTQSVAEFYKEASYGQHLLTGTVASSGGAWLQASVAAPVAPANVCDYGLIGSEGDAAATAAGYNLASYPNRVYVFANTGFSCGWAGLAYVGYGRAWINQTTNLLVIGHELGHNFGLLHAASLDCGVEVVGGTCTSSEYGDPFGTMGNQRAMHFNAYQKRLMSWITPAQTPTHPAGTTTYNLTPIETPGGSLYAIRIQAAANRIYWVEYRQPIGFDSGLSAYPNNGAQIRVASPFESICGGCGDDTEFLDMTPATGAFTDGALLVGQTYTDLTYGVTINVLSATPSQLSVRVTAAGGPAPTTTTLTSSLNPATVGANVTITASVTGTSPTGSVAFKDGGSTLGTCSAVALSGAGNTRTATCSTTTLTQGTHSLTATYVGDAANATSTSAALSQVVNAGAPAPTTTTLASSLNPSTLNANVLLTATVNGTNPTGTVAFKDGGNVIGACGAIAVSGAGNARTAACSTTALAQGTHSLTVTYSGDATNATSTSVALSQVVNPGGGASINVALAANGGVASASSSSGGFNPAGANNGDGTGANWGSNTSWNDATFGSFPDWLEIDFAGQKTINKVVVYSLQDNHTAPITPTDTTTFSSYGLVDFTVQALVGGTWTTIATVTNNNLVKRSVAFASITTDRIRINVTRSSDGAWSRIVEVEAWTI